MKILLGKPGTASGLLLRLGQCLFAGSSIGIMVTAYRFSNYTAFCGASLFSYLIASMGLQLLWSFGLACLDMYAVRGHRDLANPILVSLFVVGDWVTATLSFAAACSSAGVMVLYAKDLHICASQKNIPCGQYQMSIALAFVTWFLVTCSSHVMFWIIASL